MKLRFFVLALWPMFFALLLAACGSAPPAPVATPQPIDTSTPTITVTSTPLPSATPSPTATPTPTALPISLLDNLRAQRSVPPTPQRGAPCGLVDFFDFPLDPPDGANAVAPWPVGIHIRGYSGLHAGEDWIYSSGGSEGRSVYSIGHGTVLYAQPYGWGVDLGTIIVRHVFTDGKTILSFYGHLQPDSVTLRPGDCVTRGQAIGLIGNPRGRPHLHFEIRTVYPDSPGPGYWPSDPTLAGWKIPTEYIWDNRVRTSPGVQWVRPFTASNSILVGLLISNTVAAIDNDRLLALEADTGTVHWTRPLTSSVRAAAIDQTRTTIYLVTLSDSLRAIDLAGHWLWEIPVTTTARSALIPSPGGGVIVAADQSLSRYSPAGERVWQIDNIAVPFEWLTDHGELLFTTSGDQPTLYRLNAGGQVTTVAALGGRLAASADQLFVYDSTALYRQGNTPGLLQPLDRVLSNDSSIVATTDGGVILAHHGVADIRLIARRADGTLRWERSLRELPHGAPHLGGMGADVYAVTQEGSVWWIDQQSGEAQRVLAGTRLNYLPGRVRAVVTDRGKLIIDFRGGRILALDPQMATEPARNRP